MLIKENTERKLRNLAGCVETLNKIFGRLLGTMERQIEAITSTDPKEIEKLTEEHSAVSVEYKSAEKKFITELKKLLMSKSDKPLKLNDLKEIYPDSSDEIEMWRELLTSNTQKLQQKHDHVVRLLEFALLRNSSMMRSIYSIKNNKTAHYNLEGNKENKMSGMAVNQEI